MSINTISLVKMNASHKIIAGTIAAARGGDPPPSSTLIVRAKACLAAKCAMP
jgi:hypothetical protein